MCPSSRHQTAGPTLSVKVVNKSLENVASSEAGEQQQQIAVGREGDRSGLNSGNASFCSTKYPLSFLLTVKPLKD
jgi:hypothetical protein